MEDFTGYRCIQVAQRLLKCLTLLFVFYYLLLPYPSFTGVHEGVVFSAGGLETRAPLVSLGEPFSLLPDSFTNRPIWTMMLPFTFL